jgi:hypothetical protein
MKKDGEFEIKYLTKDNKLIDKKIVSEPLATAIYSHTNYESAIFDMIQAPLKDYQSIKIKLTVLKPESDFNDKGKEFYFYVDESFYLCGKNEGREICSII